MEIALEILLTILGIILGLIALYGLAVGSTLIFWIIKFLKNGDG
jgi:hypothetical protein